VILWVRHGQSTWNVLDRLQGQTAHPPLTELGRAQSAHAAGSLADAGAVRLLTSPAVRAQQTAEIIGSYLGLEVETEPLLLERDLDEEITDVLVRIRTFLDRDHRDHTIAVSHGDTIALAVGMLSGRPPTPPANASVTWVDPHTGDVQVTSPPD